MNPLTATVTMRRPRPTRAGKVEPARSACAMTRPPNMSPLTPPGVGMTFITSSLLPDGWLEKSDRWVMVR